MDVCKSSSCSDVREPLHQAVRTGKSLSTNKNTEEYATPGLFGRVWMLSRQNRQQMSQVRRPAASLACLRQMTTPQSWTGWLKSLSCWHVHILVCGCVNNFWTSSFNHAAWARLGCGRLWRTGQTWPGQLDLEFACPVRHWGWPWPGVFSDWVTFPKFVGER